MSNKTIGNICYLLNGYAFKSSHYVDNGIRIIRIANVQKGYIEDSTPAFYPLDSKGLGNYMLEEGDLLMSLTGNVGRVALLSGEMLPAALNQRVACLRLKDNSIDKKFLFHYLNSSIFENKCIKVSKGVAQKNMSTEWLKRQEIPNFTYSKQKEISKALDYVSDIITAKMKQLIEYDQLIKSRFVEMFGNPLENSKNWRRETLGDLCKVINGRAYKKSELLNKGKYRILRVGNFFTNNNWYYSNLELPSEKYCDNGDLLFAWSASFGPRIWQEEKVIYHYHIWKIDDYQENLNKIFLLEQLNYNVLLLKENSHGSTMMHLTKTNMEKQHLIVPPLALQNNYAYFFEQVDRLKSAVQLSLNETQQLFDSLMQEYFG